MPEDNIESAAQETSLAPRWTRAKEVLQAIGILAALFFGLRAELRYRAQEEILISIVGAYEYDAPTLLYIEPFGEGECWGDVGGLIIFPFTVQIDNISNRPITIREFNAVPLLNGEPIDMVRFTGPNLSMETGVNGSLRLATNPSELIELPVRLEEAAPLDLEFDLGWPLGCEEIAALEGLGDPPRNLYSIESNLYASGTSLGRASIALSAGGGGIALYIEMLEPPTQLLKLEVVAAGGIRTHTIFSFEAQLRQK